jgi:hypothetical protein
MAFPEHGLQIVYMDRKMDVDCFNSRCYKATVLVNYTLITQY